MLFHFRAFLPSAFFAEMELGHLLIYYLGEVDRGFTLAADIAHHFSTPSKSIFQLPVFQLKRQFVYLFDLLRKLIYVNAVRLEAGVQLRYLGPRLVYEAHILVHLVFQRVHHVIERVRQIAQLIFLAYLDGVKSVFKPYQIHIFSDSAHRAGYFVRSIYTQREKKQRDDEYDHRYAHKELVQYPAHIRSRKRFFSDNLADKIHMDLAYIPQRQAENRYYYADTDNKQPTIR
jgi:hypothetical protein